MPFLFHQTQAFTLVSHKSKQGIFYQTYTQRGFSRPILLHNYPTTLYSAALDQDGTLHIVSQTSKTQITYFKINDMQVNKQVILEDTKNNYAFSNLSIHCLHDKVYLFYTALHPTGSTRSLMCQILTQSPTLYTLIQTLPDTPVLDIFTIGETISLIYMTFDETYILRHITIDNNFGSEDLLQSKLPISTFNLCRSPEALHLLYVVDNFGKSQLMYVNTKYHVPVLLITATTIHNPCIFYYLGYIWVTYMDNQKLYMLLSLDDGITFSAPTPCSLQSNLDYYTFISTTPLMINGSSIYASLLNTIRLPIVANLDTSGIHPDLYCNTELEVLLEGIKLHYSTSSLAPPLPAAPPIPTPLTTAPTSESPKKTTSLLQAKKAFMEQGHGFDAAPR